MEPIGFGAEQIAFLPPHRLTTYAKDQPQYQPLPVVQIEGAEGRVISRGALTPEERARVAQGEDLYIEVLTFHQPLQPILPTVGLRDLCPLEVKG